MKTTEELDFLSTLDSEAGGSVEQLETIDAMTSDRVQNRYADPQLKTGVEGTDDFQKIFEGDITHNNLWMVERDSNNQWF